MLVWTVRFCFLWLAVACMFTALSNKSLAGRGHANQRPSFPHANQPTAAQRPNFVVMFADDTGWGDVGANWPSNMNTPNLDKMASKGMRLTDFHAGASVCTPSRAALLTGRLGKRTGVTHNFGPTSVGGLPLNETTIAEHLKKNGYSTGMIGKWHLGVYQKYHPFYRGFDFYYGLPYSNDMGCTDTPGYNKPMAKPCCHDNNSQKNCSSNLGVPLYHNASIIEQPVDLVTLAGRYGNMAKAFISAAAKAEAPFLLYIAFAHMHVPQNHAPNFTNSSDNGPFGDTLRELDHTVGTVLSALDESGVNEDTLVLFTADNGPWETKCNLTGSKGPFIGKWQRSESGGGGGGTAKFTTWEGGHREPTIAYWPGKIAPNSTTNALASALDIFPTLSALSGSEMPSDRHYDGIDLTDVLFGKNEAGHDWLFHPNSGAGGDSGGLNALRVGQYKVFYQTAPAGDCTGPKGKTIQHNPPLIFDLNADVAEETPLTSSHPSYETIVNKATQLMQEMAASIANDKTSTADYSSNKTAAPCCDMGHVCCRCEN